MKTTVQPPLNRLPSNPAATNVALLPRALALITILNEVDKFHGAYTVAEETRPGPDGRQLAVQVLYAGLAQAWFVNTSGDFAGTGVPTPNGWQWTPRNELARQLQFVATTLQRLEAAGGGGKVPEAMASGISQALFPPEVGLCIALPGLLLTHLSGANGRNSRPFWLAW